MLRLLLLRHAKSDWPDGVDDHERPLAERGRRASPLMARYMAGEGLIPDLALVSTARRTQETWELLRPVIGDDTRWREEPRIYEAPARVILDVVRTAEPGIGTLLVVGHNPGLHDAALRLAGSGRESDLTRLRQKYPTAGLAVIDFTAARWSELADQSGELERFVTPRTIGHG
ncbi:SixA phosphatase family protein [Phyllobacterium myrsinacearum]|uniref:Phosphoglycerate mutase n=1 Tax=Phyllobacterium myrsinacearum TaxID=28101 RepID=A0A2S9JFI2_9HYPH|nr:histidine phosphatase family protein [Phyllobacterium myrsinacearum]PRD51677.1 phosphoglycerate mutase [Phyllobacterium myrsinacearum]PWV89454.1 phosphohistidine phosphatase [Phyllobacterium myrsinacearum]RZU99954.1 phosphohistidine phosphatase [Phyllobacterium myrsinacearum]